MGCATVDRVVWPDVPKEALAIFDKGGLPVNEFHARVDRSAGGLQVAETHAIVVRAIPSGAGNSARASGRSRANALVTARVGLASQRLPEMRSSIFFTSIRFPGLSLRPVTVRVPARCVHIQKPIDEAAVPWSEVDSADPIGCEGGGRAENPEWGKRPGEVQARRESSEWF